MSYQVYLSPGSERDLVRLPKNIQVEAQKVIDSLVLNPRPNGCKKLSNQDLFRVRFSTDYRIIYEINDKLHYVLVQIIGHKSKVYRNL